MINRLVASARCAIAVGLIACLLVAGGCACDCAYAPTMSIKDLIASDTYKQSADVPSELALDTLVYYLDRHPELVELMTGTTSHTLFAPSNEAFARLKSTPGFSKAPNALKLIEKKLLRGVLSLHFVEGSRSKADLTSGMVLQTRYIDPFFTAIAQTITVNQDGTLKSSPTAANVAVDMVAADGTATNGVVHVIEAVLTPYFPEPHVLFGKVLEKILLSEDFDNVTKVIMAADQGFVENASTLQFKVTTWLLMPIATTNVATPNLKGITFFAPLDPSGASPGFTEAMADALIASPDKGRSFLLNHLVVSVSGGAQSIGQYSVADPPTVNPNGITKLANLQQITPVSGEARKITVSVTSVTSANPTGVSVSNKSAPGAADFRPVMQKDVSATNGILHGISGVLD